MSWHSRSCHLDLFWTEDKPACRRCGRIAPAPKAVEAIPPAPPPPHTKRSELRCRWPPQVHYSDDYSEDPEFQEEIEYIRANVDDWEVGSFWQVPATEARSEITTGAHIANATESCTRDTSEARNEMTLAPSSTEPETWPVSDDRIEMEPSMIYGGLHDSDSIRLLHLYGSQECTEPIHCSLETIGLHDPDAPVFEALSYTWADPLTGDAKLSQPIYVGSDLDILLVTRNCAAALRQFRRKEDRVIWVDAICINQADGQERGSQVALMQDIYSLASRVLIYLGPGDDETDLAMRHILDPALPHEPWAANTAYANAMRRLIHKPYFRRAWVVQEVKLAHKATVTCGSYTVHWTIFCQFFKTSEARYHCAVDDSWVVNDYSQKHTQTLIDHMMNTRNCSCGDLRDKVFSVLGLVQSSKTPGLPVDYSRSVQAIFTGLASYFLQVLNNDTSYLSYACNAKGTPYLPSWVPEWSPSVEKTEELVEVEFSIAMALSVTPEISSLRSNNRTKVLWKLPHICPSYMAVYNVKAVHKLKIFYNTASLYIDAYPIFSYCGGKSVLTCFPDEPAWQELRGSAHVSFSEQEKVAPGSLYGFYVPNLSSMLMLKKHSKRTYSLYRRFTMTMQYGWEWSDPAYSHRYARDVIASIRGDAELLNPYQPALVTRVLGDAETSLIRKWSLKVLYIIIHHAKDISLYPKAPQALSHVSNEAIELNDTLVFLMEEMRKEILDIVSLHDVQQMQTRYLDIQKKPVDPSFMDEEYFRVDEKQYEALEKDSWNRLNTVWGDHHFSPNDQIIAWRDAIDTLKGSIVRYGSIIEAFETLSDGPLAPYWESKFQNRHHYTQFNELVGWTRQPPFIGFHYLTTGPALIHGAWSLLYEIQLDAKKPWVWNRDRFWIHIATLEMLAGLHETLRHRQVLHGFDLAKKSGPERIIIV
jgi:hypothetical protein